MPSFANVLIQTTFFAVVVLSALDIARDWHRERNRKFRRVAPPRQKTVRCRRPRCGRLNLVYVDRPAGVVANCGVCGTPLPY